MRTLTTLFTFACLLGCKPDAPTPDAPTPDASKKDPDKKAVVSDGTLVKAVKEATTCEDLQKIYTDNKAEIEKMGKDIPSTDNPDLVALAKSCIKNDFGVTDPAAQDNTPTSCGCLLSGWDCFLVFGGCMGGDEPACCWFSEACIHDTVMSDCMTACNNCSSWTHEPPPGEG
jgi:hypothetical protein